MYNLFLKLLDFLTFIGFFIGNQLYLYDIMNIYICFVEKIQLSASKNRSLRNSRPLYKEVGYSILNHLIFYSDLGCIKINRESKIHVSFENILLFNQFNRALFNQDNNLIFKIIYEIKTGKLETIQDTFDNGKILYLNEVIF